MKPEGMDTEINYPIENLIPEIICDRNMYESFDYVIDHLENGHQKENYRPLRDKIVAMLQDEIRRGVFRILPSDVRQIHVTDGPKERDVQAPRVIKRVGCHAIMVIVEKYTYPTLIKNTGASVKGRGMHWQHHIIEEDLQNVPLMMLYYYQNDIEHYYDNISQERMKGIIRGFISDQVLLPILDSFITLLPQGLSKGLRSSQCFANLYLSIVDHVMCEHVLKYERDGECRYLYDRYCDDVVMWHYDKKELWKLRDIYVKEVAKLNLRVKPNEAIRPIQEGLDHLGFVHYDDYSLIRKRTKKNAARKLAKVKSRKRRQEIIGSFKGMACHADCKHLFYILTGKKMDSFSKLKKSVPPFKGTDGKKRFQGKRVSIKTLQNKHVLVVDYEKDVKTDNGSRHLILVDDKGEQKKFFTADKEMKYYVEQFDDHKMLPKPVTVEYDNSDGFGHYILVFEDPDGVIPPYRDESGKKHFRGKVVSIKTLQNKHIVIIDFERDVPTDNGLRHLVSVDDNGILKKYFTDDKEQKYYLEAYEANGNIPFDTTIEYDDSNGYGHYIFT